MPTPNPHEPRESTLARGWTVEPEAHPSEPPAAALTPRSDDDVSMLTEHDVEAQPSGSQVSNLSLVLLGVFGGLYLLYTWVWISWAQYYAAVNAATAAGSGSIGGVLQQIVFWAVPFAPALWFLTAIVVSAKRTGRLAAGLILGAAVLVPLPMFISSGAAL